MTAYFGLLEIGKPKTGETVLISGAAGRFNIKFIKHNKEQLEVL